jgi:hypothetical protein
MLWWDWKRRCRMRYIPKDFILSLKIESLRNP